MPSHSSGSEDGERVTGFPLWRWFLLIVLVLVAIGFFNIYSSTFYMNLEDGVSPYGHVLRHGGYFVVGLLFALFFYIFPFSGYAKLGVMLVGMSFVMLVLIFIIGKTVNGATRWIYVGFSIQPSEIAKVVAVMWAASGLAALLERKQPLSLWSALLWKFRLTRWIRSKIFGEKPGRQPASVMALYQPLSMPMVFAFLILKQPDMGTAALVAGFPVLMYMLCGIPKFDIILTLVSSVIAFFGLALSQPYRWERVRVLWDPFSYATDAGYQTVQSLIAVGSGGFLGQGAGEGLAKFLYLPEQHTDFAYAVLGQEGGFLLAGTVMLLFAALLVVGFLMASRIPKLYPALLVYGLTMLISIEGFLNMAMVIGSFPVTGVPLPFISFGGSSLVMNLIAVGIIGNAVHYGEKLREEAERKRKLEAFGIEPPSLQKISGTVFRPPEDERFRRY